MRPRIYFRPGTEYDPNRDDEPMARKRRQGLKGKL